ncbi:hypothetical protein AVEN_44843-1 [Araneus ventricosus]|uniref:Uncharacterized protein n=1 Tax=Araneus ventricosus TaxID=182803 RepID=A0A4Y2CLV0_ARAVE|nr:hypothetical protein AVEN_44843-1 [Araneus ventricosus]
MTLTAVSTLLSAVSFGPYYGKCSDFALPWCGSLLDKRLRIGHKESRPGHLLSCRDSISFGGRLKDFGGRLLRDWIWMQCLGDAVLCRNDNGRSKILESLQ